MAAVAQQHWSLSEYTSGPCFRCLRAKCKGQSPPPAAASIACICKMRHLAREHKRKGRQGGVAAAAAGVLSSAGLLLHAADATSLVCTAQSPVPMLLLHQRGYWFHTQRISVTSELAVKITMWWKYYSRILKTKQNKQIMLKKQLGGEGMTKSWWGKPWICLQGMAEQGVATAVVLCRLVAQG